MAQRLIPAVTVTICDLSQREVSKVTEYEFTFKPANAKANEKVTAKVELSDPAALALFNFLKAPTQENAAALGAVTYRTVNSGKGNSNSDASKIRAWAKEKGIPVSEIGVIAQSVKDKYYAEANS